MESPERFAVCQLDKKVCYRYISKSGAIRSAREEATRTGDEYVVSEILLDEKDPVVKIIAVITPERVEEIEKIEEPEIVTETLIKRIKEKLAVEKKEIMPEETKES